MDKYPKYRKKPTKHAAIDGFFTNGFKPTENNNFRRTQSYQPMASIGNFRRPEGFKPIDRQSVISTTRQARNRNPVESNVRLDGLALEPRRHKPKRRWGRMLMRTTMTIFLIGIISGGYLFGKGYLKARQIFKGGSSGAAALQENVDPSLLKGEGDGRVNIMVLGKGGPGHTGADLTDTLLVASVDPLQKEAALLSIPRDLYVKVPNLGSMKINAVYATAKEDSLSGTKRTKDDQKKAEEAGLGAIQKSLEQSLGIPIHYYTMVDFEAFRQAIDTVGGITIDVKEQLYDPTVAWENNKNPLIAAKGLQTMNGKRALLYARSRHGSARGDFDRAERQREIIIGLKDKVLSVGTFANPLKLSQLTDAFGDHVQTNLTTNEVMRLYAIGKDIPSNKIVSIGLADPPNNYVTTDFVNGQSVVVPRAGVFNFKDIQNFVRNNLKDGFIRNENSSVIVLNGTTTTGLATRKAEELKSFGYNVDRVGDAPTKNYSRTILVNLRGSSKKYTQRYLEQRLKVTAVSNLPDGAIEAGAADFVIILGQNETTNLQN